MRNIQDMDFEFYYGSCNTFVAENEEFVLLCFSRSSTSSCHRWRWVYIKSNIFNLNAPLMTIQFIGVILFHSWCTIIFCFRFDGTNFYSSSSTTFTHYNTLGMGNYRGQPFTTGGDGNTDTEILTISSDVWRIGASYPFSSRWNFNENNLFFQ